MNDSPFVILLYVGMAAYVGNIYWGDYKAQRDGAPNASAMPGATAASLGLFVIGVIGALLLLAVETGGEIALGIAGEQSEMVWYFVFASLAAGVVEEVIFRGYLVIDKKGRAALIASCVGFSLIFAIIHMHLFEFVYPDDVPWWKIWLADFSFTFTQKSFFSTSILLANSLWFYALRFGPWNKNRSLFPCMLAHAASNFGVFAVKWVQGFVIF